MRPTVAEWVAKAEEDFAILERESRVRKNPAYGGMCFHAQQCAEKYLKARLAQAGLGFPRTHDLMLLLKHVTAVEPMWELFRPHLSFLSDFAVEARYPGVMPERQTARDALRRCREFRRAARAALRLPVR